MGNIERGESGVTLRDFFMAHAPEEIPDWFEPQGICDRPDTTLWEDIKGALGFTPFSLRAWCRQNECARMVQWPVYWADAMLAARENSND